MLNFDRALFLAEIGRLKFVVPPAFPWSPGHYIHDVHNFFLNLNAGSYDKSLFYVYPFHEAEIPLTVFNLIKAFVNVYFSNVHLVFNNKVVYEVCQLALVYPEYVVCPNSPICRLVIPKGLSRSDCRVGSILLGHRYFTIPTIEERRWVENYLTLSAASPHCNPFWHSISQLADMVPLPYQNKKLALIQAKTKNANCAVFPNDYLGYKELIEYFFDTDHNVVVVGRENHQHLPYHDLISHYSTSGNASFFADLCLFAASSISVIGGSGIGIIPAVFNKPLVMNNIPLFVYPQALSGCVSIPPLVYSFSKNNYLSVSEVDLLITQLPNAWDVLPDNYSGENTRQGNPYSIAFANGHHRADTSLSNKFLVEAVKLSQGLATCNENNYIVNNFTRFSGLTVKYPISYIQLLRENNLLC